MPKGIKIAGIITIILFVLLISCTGFLVIKKINPIDFVREQFWKNDPQYVTDAADKMASFTLPEDYSAENAYCAWETCTAVFSKKDSSASKIVFLNTGINNLEEEYRIQIEESWSQKIYKTKYSTKTTEVKDIKINGVDKKLRILEGTDDQGRSIRQAVTIFKGKNGDVMLILVDEKDKWDDKIIEEFINSIKT